jgi:hypothetical protein
LQKKEQKNLRSKEKILWEIVRKLVKKGKTIEQKSLLKNVHRKETTRRLRVEDKECRSKRQEKQPVIDFSVALVIWFLLHMQPTLIHRKEKQREVSKIKNEKPNKLFVKEPALWLIFAIIWHLAMIREQGMRRGLNDSRYTKKTVQKQKFYWKAMLPPTGVIFAFHP